MPNPVSPSNVLFVFIAFCTLTCLGGCINQPPKTSLYERMGGLPVITSVVNETIDQVSTDPKTKRSFEGIKLKTLKQSIVNQLCDWVGCRAPELL